MDKGGDNGARRPAAGRSFSGRPHGQQLPAASSGRARSARGTNCRGAPRPCRSRTCPSGAKAAAGGADPTLGPAGLRGLPRVRVSRANPPPASAPRSRPRRHRLPYPLELVAGSPIGRAELFGAALEVGQGDGSWAGCRQTEPAGNAAAVSTGPWPAEAYAGELITPKQRTGLRSPAP